MRSGGSNVYKSLFYYLTEVEGLEWRTQDWTANKVAATIGPREPSPFRRRATKLSPALARDLLEWAAGLVRRSPPPLYLREVEGLRAMPLIRHDGQQVLF